MLTVGLLCTMMAAGCREENRRTVVLSHLGERVVTVRAPRIPVDSPEAPHLVHWKDLRGEEFPFDPPIWSLQGLTVSRDGTIFLADRGHGHIVITDTEGRYLGRIGSKGPGPFEFQTTFPSISIGLCWISRPEILAAFDWPTKVIFFARDGTCRSQAVRNAISFLEVASSDTSLLVLARDLQPFREYTPDGTLLHSFGRIFDPEDAAWRDVSEIVAGSDVGEYPYGGIAVPNCRLPLAVEVAGPLLIHDLGWIGNGYRAWDRASGEVVWQLNLAIPDWEPPTLFTYSTSGLNDLFRWERGGQPEIARHSYIDGIRYREGWIFAISFMIGDGRRREPDHAVATNPASRWELDELGFRDMPVRGAVDVISPEPDLVAHIPFETEHFALFEVLPGPVLLCAYNDPEPHLALYRVEGLPPPPSPISGPAGR